MTGKSGKLFDAKTVLFSSFVLILFSILVILILFPGGRTLSHNSSSFKDADTMYRELAAKLTSVGVHGEAIKAYEDYFSTARLDKRTRSNIAYTVGRLHMEAGNYEKALSWLYRVDMIDPATPLKSEVNGKLYTAWKHWAGFTLPNTHWTPVVPSQKRRHRNARGVT